jgi:enterochelin esterase-like enzyme
MVFLGEHFWMDEMPVYRLMQHLVEKGKYKNLLLSITDSVDQIVSTITAFRNS